MAALLAVGEALRARIPAEPAYLRGAAALWAAAQTSRPRRLMPLRVEQRWFPPLLAAAALRVLLDLRRFQPVPVEQAASATQSSVVRAAVAEAEPSSRANRVLPVVRAVFPVVVAAAAGLLNPRAEPR